MLLDTLPQSCRPREKLLNHGAQALSEVELLALLLRTGTVGRSVLQMAEELLQQFGGLGGLLKAPRAELARVKGLGPAKQAELQAVLEIARRVLTTPLTERPILREAQAVEDLLRLQMGGLGHEIFAVLFLDSQLRLIQFEEVFRGTLTQTAVYPREIVQRALHHRAAAVVLAHNHPSGVTEPSSADIQLTQRLSAALALIDVRVLDHFVVGQSACASMAQRGLM
ncbi:RadC family protein [Inhella gelatinilytica]|uniref:DNA repair protein RadC n=1 Tax=Inhella gelatinilytica TaxID=2795030 RepID=A0A931IYH3_9BURK|nr:DNA repair protein RadC [Inhella gelatinilytica]MBH9553409.1 DNA repair protein RadC [Inhella gelatinilytica]